MLDLRACHERTRRRRDAPLRRRALRTERADGARARAVGCTPTRHARIAAEAEVMLSLARGPALAILALLHPLPHATPRALQAGATACPCDDCVAKDNTVADCESFGMDCACYRNGAGTLALAAGASSGDADERACNITGTLSGAGTVEAFGLSLLLLWFAEGSVWDLFEEENRRKQGKEYRSWLFEPIPVPYGCALLTNILSTVLIVVLAILFLGIFFVSVVQSAYCGGCEDGDPCEPGSALCNCTEGAPTSTALPGPRGAGSATTPHNSDGMLVGIVASCTLAGLVAVVAAIYCLAAIHCRKQQHVVVQFEELSDEAVLEP